MDSASIDLWGLLISIVVAGLLVGLPAVFSIYFDDERVLLRRIRRIGERIRTLVAEFEAAERRLEYCLSETYAKEFPGQFIGEVLPNHVGLVQSKKEYIPPTQEAIATQRLKDIAAVSAKHESLGPQLVAARKEWVEALTAYARLRPPPQGQPETYRSALPKMRIAPVIEETEELLERIERKTATADP